MHCQSDPHLFAHRYDGPQEIGHIFAQLRFIDVVIFRRARGTGRGCSPLPPRQAGDDIAGQFLNVRFAHRLVIRLGPALLFFAVIRFRPRAFEDMQFKGGEGDLIETQRPEPSGSSYSRSVLVQSRIGIKL